MTDTPVAAPTVREPYVRPEPSHKVRCTGCEGMASVDEGRLADTVVDWFKAFHGPHGDVEETVRD